MLPGAAQRPRTTAMPASRARISLSASLPNETSRRFVVAAVACSISTRPAGRKPDRRSEAAGRADVDVGATSPCAGISRL